MTRHDLIQKWLTYALGVVPFWILDAFVLPRFPVLGVSPMLLPATVTAVAVLEGAYGGAGFGLGVGLFWELAYPGGFGLMVFGMSLAGFLSGKAASLFLSPSFPGYLFCSAVTYSAVDALRVLRGLITRSATLPVLLRVAVPEVLLSMVWTPVVFVVFRMICNQVGGDRLR